MLTRLLVVAIALLAAAGLWRLARWHWRPRLELPSRPTVTREPGGIRLSVEVRNDGAGRGRRCRARLLRAERREGGRWVRVDAPEHPAAETAPPATGIPAHGSARLAVNRLLPLEAGRYRVELAVVNGDEMRASYVIDVDAAGNPFSP